jgi:hypothetical protein
MKPSAYKTFSFIVSLSGSFAIIFFGLPLWTFALFIPALIYTQILVSNNYTFRDSLALEPIPETGYEKRLQDLETNQPFLSQIGFVKFDEFYMQTSNDLVAFVYQHLDLPIIALDYDLEILKQIDFDTKFEGEITLTTTNCKTAYMHERSDEKLIQSFPEMSFEELFNKHKQAVEFLKDQGLEPLEINHKYFRQEFLDEFIQVGKKFKGILSPFTTLHRYKLGNEYEYRKPIQEQFLARSFQLPEDVMEHKSHLLQQ